MSGKINVFLIISGHLKTLRNDRTHKISILDFMTFFGLPVAIAVFCAVLGLKVNKDVLSLLVNFGAIFTALLLSVLVLVYDQESKIDDRLEAARREGLSIDMMYQTKKDLLRQLYFNISFSVVVSLALVVVCFLFSVVQGYVEGFKQDAPDICWVYVVLSAFSVFLVVNIVLTIIMILKRLHNLLIAQ